MVFESLCAALIALLLGLAVCFAGYRFFLALLLGILFFAPGMFFPESAFEPADPFVTPPHIKPEW